MKRNTQFGVMMTSALMFTLIGVNVMATNESMFITEGDYKHERTSVERNTERNIASTFSDDIFYSTTFIDSGEIVSSEQDMNVLTFYAEQKTEEEKLKRIQEMYERTSWLKEYGINPSDLSEERLSTLAEARKYVGLPYVYGGTTPRGFDCSGYTRWVLKQVFGIDISRTTVTQPRSKYLKQVPISEAKPGDLFYKVGQHTGFFLKDLGNKILILHSPRTGKRIQVSKYSKNVKIYRPTSYNEE